MTRPSPASSDWSCSTCGTTQRHHYAYLCKKCYEVDWAKRQTIPDDVDDVAVIRCIQGDRAALTRGERIEVVHRLTERGFSAAQIGDCLGVPARTVQRDRQALSVNGRLARQVAS